VNECLLDIKFKNEVNMWCVRGGTT